MKRRDMLKSMALGGFGLVMPKSDTPSVLEDGDKDKIKVPNGRTKEEAIRDARLKTETFFTPHELKTVTVLSDIILPSDGTSGSASQAGVPAFIAFMMIDQPANQTAMRGGLMWLDNQSRKRFEKRFIEISYAQQIEIVEDIAYPEKKNPEFTQGIAFFSLMRNMVMTGFYTTEMGFKDLGYVGNRPNNWEGVPEDVLKQYGFEKNE
jgi:gluconate 2-dehydrogenase gamma chain